MLNYLESSTRLMQISTNITTSPFLPNNVIATNYSNLKLMAQIEEINSYFYCSWFGDDRLLATIFSSGSFLCRNRTVTSFYLTCVETNNVVTVTATFTSPVQENDGRVYQIRCRVFDLLEVIVAQIHIEISGNSSTIKFYIFYVFF